MGNRRLGYNGDGDADVLRFACLYGSVGRYLVVVAGRQVTPRVLKPGQIEQSPNIGSDIGITHPKERSRRAKHTSKTQARQSQAEKSVRT